MRSFNIIFLAVVLFLSMCGHNYEVAIENPQMESKNNSSERIIFNSDLSYNPNNNFLDLVNKFKSAGNVLNLEDLNSIFKNQIPLKYKEFRTQYFFDFSNYISLIFSAIGDDFIDKYVVVFGEKEYYIKSVKSVKLRNGVQEAICGDIAFWFDQQKFYIVSEEFECDYQIEGKMSQHDIILNFSDTIIIYPIDFY